MIRFILAALLVAHAAPAAAFEGVLHMTTTIAQVPPIASDVSLRGNGDSRTDSVVPGTGESLSIIQKTRGHRITTLTLMHRSRTYTETTAAPPEPSAATTSALRDLQIKQLGSEAVAGYPCKHAQLIQKNGMSFEVWMTTALDIDMAQSPNRQGMAAEMLKVLEANDLQGFPLKMKATHQGQSLVVETTKVEAKTLDSALFAAPPGYSKAAIGQ